MFLIFLNTCNYFLAIPDATKNDVRGLENACRHLSIPVKSSLNHSFEVQNPQSVTLKFRMLVFFSLGKERISLLLRLLVYEGKFAGQRR